MRRVIGALMVAALPGSYIVALVVDKGWLVALVVVAVLAALFGWCLLAAHLLDGGR